MQGAKPEKEWFINRPVKKRENAWCMVANGYGI
jgi:hypothetical protein